MLTDFMALYWAGGKCPICNAAKKGLAEAFHTDNWLNCLGCEPTEIRVRISPTTQSSN